MTEKPKSSQNLAELRSMAFVITKDRKIALKWSDSAETACYDFVLNEITLTDNCLPKEVRKMPKTWKKAIDGLLSHEAGHRMISLPIWDRYKRQIDNSANPWLMAKVQNIIEDKRVNRFIENRYRFDYGKRLKLCRDLIKSEAEQSLVTKKAEWESKREGELIYAIIVDTGLYGADLSKLYPKLTPEGKKDLDTALELLEDAKYTRIKSKLLKLSADLFNILKKYSIAKQNINCFIPSWFDGEGKLSEQIKKELKKQLEKEEEDEKSVKNDKKDLNRGGGAGKGTGEELKAPEPDFGAYSQLVEQNKPEIEKLLNKLKIFVKPVVKRELYTKRGRIMPQILSRAYVNSLKRPQTKIYMKNSVEFEKQKVAIGLILDLSGSMNESEAKNVMTTLNEVFGQWLNDESYTIMAFASEFCKIKTFYEAFDNTRARVGGNFGIGWGTVSAPSLKAMEQLFNGLSDEITKILIFVTDFEFSYEDKEESRRICQNMAKTGIKQIMIDLDSYSKGTEMADFCRNLKNTYQMSIKSVEELPEMFVDIYSRAISQNQ